MESLTIILIIASLLLSIVTSWFLYFYQQKKQGRVILYLFGLRALGFFLLLLLLINPSIQKRKITHKKPVLSVLVDNSFSIKYLQKEKEVTNIVQRIANNKTLLDRFELQIFQFGNEVKILDSLDFKESNSAIYKALSEVASLDKLERAPIVLISDGNQTKGISYPFINTEKNLFPLAIGDSLPQTDLKITNVHSNAFSYLKNRFPVELTVVYEGTVPISRQLVIEYKGKPVFRKKLSFNAIKNLHVVSTNLLAEREGLHFYKASISPLLNEKNVVNNERYFSIEVLSEQSKTLLLTNSIHPDIGALKKAIETNKHRSMDIQTISKFSGDISDFQLLILYQPSEAFQKIFEQINKEKLNYIVITGAQTNWSFLNEMQPNYYKNGINQTENYGALYNNGYIAFGQKNIGFEELPPLKDLFGKIELKTKYDALLYQNIAGIETQTPLLATFENGNQRSGVLFGEGIWKWRASTYMKHNDFQGFDAFLGNLMQYLASKKQRDRLSLSYEKLYAANSSIFIKALYLDKNYVFDARANLQLTLRNKLTNETMVGSFSQEENSFTILLEDLVPGTYSFVVRVVNQKMQREGEFKILEYNIEEQFTKANHVDLQILATKTEGEMFYEGQVNNLLETLISDKRYVTKQQSTIKQENLIEWKYLLIMVIFVFSLEWFIRKYIGKI